MGRMDSLFKQRGCPLYDKSAGVGPINDGAHRLCDNRKTRACGGGAYDPACFTSAYGPGRTDLAHKNLYSSNRRPDGCPVSAVPRTGPVLTRGTQEYAGRNNNQCGDSQGGKVRVLLDILGSRLAWTVVHPDAPEPPLGRNYHIVRHLRNESNISVRCSHNTWLSSDHVKFFTIDGEYAFLGGMNIGWQYRYKWRDMMCELTGGIVGELEQYFDAAWGRTGWFSDLALLRHRRTRQAAYGHRPGDILLFPLVTTPWRKNIYNTMLQAIRNAEQRIYIDDWAFWGSANFDDLSLHKNIELILATDDADLVHTLVAILLEGQDDSHEVLAPLPTEIWDGLSSVVSGFM